MSTLLNTTTETASMFQLKGGMYTLTALQLLGTNMSLFEQQLNQKIQQAPKFFHNAPIVVDLQKIKAEDSIDFNHLKTILQNNNLVPVGVRSGHKEHQLQATRAGLALLTINISDQENTSEPENKTKSETREPAIVKGSPSKVITEPVRSGQQIYARGGDLIILAHVSHGAELLADGHIHIYGALRGRALAGITGDQTAHIFCHHLEAELISIAGQYKISEDIEPTTLGTAVDIFLLNDRLHIRPL